MLISALDQSMKIGAVCLGTFDGVHLGHQAIFKKTCEVARQRQGLSVVFTFYPHPGAMVGRNQVGSITTRQQRARLIAECGLDLLIEHPFTAEFASLSPEQFVHEVLLRSFPKATVVAGFNYRFGHAAQGNVEILRTLGERHSFSVVEVPPVFVDGAIVSSTRVRQDILAGNFASITACLGRVFALQGAVGTGDGRGRTLGFPTANVHFLPEQVLPPSGVYAVFSRELGYGVANLGKRPTFPQASTTLEVHFFSPTPDLYGQELEVELLHYLRPESRFADQESLRLQIAKDIADASVYTLHQRT
ncbi:MAG: riboflavin biosynthesis protein RibF [Firmicutes bacterium]|nr:riboflavin biosynthesis protein RibF [Dethiobacter sp.]MBS3888693.1 riboflavin biosynthesis protein RibF [Bacillota bacterium]